jgi:hypothetical protein
MVEGREHMCSVASVMEDAMQSFAAVLLGRLCAVPSQHVAPACLDSLIEEGAPGRSSRNFLTQFVSVPFPNLFLCYHNLPGAGSIIYGPPRAEGITHSD